MVVNDCGCKLAGRLDGQAVSAKLKKEGVTPHLGVCRHSLQYESRPDWRLGNMKYG